jgi:hypothetical protein
VTRTRPASWGIAFVVVAASLIAGCSDYAPDDDAYHPAEVEEIANSDVKKVTLTSDAASRIDLDLATAQRNDEQTVVPHAAIVYDGEGAPWVYTSPGELTFVRTAVVVDRVEGDMAWLSQGLRPGSRVVTVGATEIYGAELDISGGH